MRNRMCIILLIVWASQWAMVIAGPVPSGGTPWWEGWLAAAGLAELVIWQANRRREWPSSRSRGGSAGGKQKRPRAVKAQGQAEASLPPAQSDASDERGEQLMTPERWGLPSEASQELPDRLYHFWVRFSACFQTKTRNTSEYAYHYLSALLRLDGNRNFATIGRTTAVAGENVQHFMSNSPWPEQPAMVQVRQELKATPGLDRGSVLLLDESANQKAGDQSAGAGRQYNGRLGKVEMSQVGTFLAYANLTDERRPLWTWVDGELFLPEHWFTPEQAELRQQVGIPPDRPFASKIELGWQMIQRVQAEGLPFDAVACDDLYGRSAWLRDQLNEAGLRYMADVPRNTQVYLENPQLGVPAAQPGRPGPKPTRLRVLNGLKPLPVHQVACAVDTPWQRLRIRATERGELHDRFAARLIWTLRSDQAQPIQEWLVIRQEGNNRCSYALSNAPRDASLEELAWLKCQRYFVERANQDAKSQIGWNDLQARKYRAWQHHLTLVILAVWFLAQTRWLWAQRWSRDPALVQFFDLEVLPALSLANIRLLLQAAMPLPQPTPDDARALVVQHLVNRTRSRKSRLSRQRQLVLSFANAPP